MKELIQKYNRPGPRYTSYPPVPFWQNTPAESAWIKNITDNYSDKEGVDLYVHVPYCEKLCYYCGCNRTITKNHDVEKPFISFIMTEWKLYQEKLGFSPRVNSLHFGGGTPTFLSTENLSNLLQVLTLNKTNEFIGSVEIDPRTCSKKHLEVFSAYGVERVSLGIQDFDPVVQEAINRIQPVSLVEDLVKEIRKQKFKSINFDLVYGLPKQTIHSIARTMEIVSDLRPDLIAFYGYAHLPDRIKNQRLINDKDLPSPDERLALYEEGKKILLSYGYEDIGLDHFALPSSYLKKAKVEGKLHRNFMGYVDKKSKILIGLGPTSISDSSVSFIQNAKEVETYKSLLSSCLLPIEKGHTHSLSDLRAQEVIIGLMCKGEAEVDMSTFPESELMRNELLSFEEDKLISMTDKRLRLTDIGKIFVRNIAMTFDHHLRVKNKQAKFSQTV